MFRANPQRTGFYNTNGVIYVGSPDSRFYALATPTGQPIWSFSTTGDQLTSAPAIADGILYLRSSDGCLVSIDLETRQQRWVFQPPHPFLLGRPCLPAIANGVIYCGGRMGQGLVALDIQTGEPNWVFEPENDTILPFLLLTYPAVADGIVCIGDSNRVIYALDGCTGQQLWAFKTESESLPSSPVIADGVVYVGTDGLLWAIELQTGQPLWKLDLPEPKLRLMEPRGWLPQLGKWAASMGWASYGSTVCSPAVADGVVYVEVCHDFYTVLCALH